MRFEKDRIVLANPFSRNLKSIEYSDMELDICCFLHHVLMDRLDETQSSCIFVSTRRNIIQDVIDFVNITILENIGYISITMMMFMKDWKN